MNWSGSPYACTVLDGPGDFEKLRPAWQGLHARCTDAHLAESFEWARFCWDRRQTGARLVFLVVSRGQQMVALLPLAIRRAGLFRTARPLACETTEYCPFLVDPSADRRAVADVLVARLRGLPGVDLLFLPWLRDDTALAAALRDTPHALCVNPLPAPFLRRSAFDSWETYWNQRSRQVRSNESRGRRRLEQQGEVRFVEITDLEARRAAWRAMVAQKRDWLVRKGVDSFLLAGDDYVRFVEASLAVAAPGARLTIFALALNGQPVATELVGVDRRRAEVFVLSYDPAFGNCAPGNVLRREVVAWAFERGLDYDWRIGAEAYKLDWANEVVSVATRIVALSGWGRGFIAYQAARSWLAGRTPEGLRRRIRSALRSLARR